MSSKFFPTVIVSLLSRLEARSLRSECARPLRHFLSACDVKVADEMGWSQTQNGLLLDAAEQAGFDVVLSGDQTIQYEQNMTGRKIGMVSMSDNHWPIVKNHVAAIADAIEQVGPGEIPPVYCGTFVPRKFGGLPGH